MIQASITRRNYVSIIFSKDLNWNEECRTKYIYNKIQIKGINEIIYINLYNRFKKDTNVR